MSDQQKLSERPWTVEHDGPSRPIIFTPDRRMLSVSEFQYGRWISGENEEDDCAKIVDALNKAKELETQLAEAIRERDEARAGVGHDWLELMEERDGYKAQREALAKALRALFKLVEDGVLVRDTSHDHESDWAMKQIPLVLTLKESREALAALERPAPADGGKA